MGMPEAGPAALRFCGLLTKRIGMRRVLAAACVLGTIAFCTQNGIRDSFAGISSPGMRGTQSLYAIGIAMVTIDGAENALLAADIDEKERQSIYSRFDAAGKSLDDSLKACENLPRSPEESRIWKDFVRALEKWGNDHERFVQLAQQYEKSRAMVIYRTMSAQALEVNPVSLSAAVTLLDAVIEASFVGREEKREITGTATFPYRQYVVGAVALGGSILAVKLIMLLARRPRSRFRKGARKLSLDLETYGQRLASARSATNCIDNKESS